MRLSDSTRHVLLCLAAVIVFVGGGVAMTMGSGPSPSPPSAVVDVSAR